MIIVLLMEEADLILDLLKKGEKRGLECLFRKFYEPLVIYAYGFLNDQAEAEDAVQEVFIKFWNRKQFTDIQLYLRSYLYRSVRNHCLNQLENRRNKFAVSLERWKDFPEIAADDDSEWFRQLEDVYREIEKLPLRTRRIFSAVFLEGKKYKEVALEEEISVNTVKTLLQRGVAALKTNLSRKNFILLYIISKKISFF